MPSASRCETPGDPPRVKRTNSPGDGGTALHTTVCDVLEFVRFAAGPGPGDLGHRHATPAKWAREQESGKAGRGDIPTVHGTDLGLSPLFPFSFTKESRKFVRCTVPAATQNKSGLRARI